MLSFVMLLRHSFDVVWKANLSMDCTVTYYDVC